MKDDKLLLERWGIMAGLGFYPPIEEAEQAEELDEETEQQLRESLRRGIKAEIAAMRDEQKLREAVRKGIQDELKRLQEVHEEGCLVGEHPEDIEPKEDAWEGGDNLEMPAVWMKILGIKDGDDE